MEDLLHINKTFEKIVAIGASIQHKEFEGCIFKHCDCVDLTIKGNYVHPQTI